MPARRVFHRTIEELHPPHVSRLSENAIELTLPTRPTTMMPAFCRYIVAHLGRFAILAISAVMLVDLPALAQCNGPVEDVLTCSSVVSGRLRPGAWGAGTPAPAVGALTTECSSGFETLNSDLGAVCNYTNVAGLGCLNGECVADPCGAVAPAATPTYPSIRTGPTMSTPSRANSPVT